MIMKNGAPNHTFARMTEKRAQPVSPSHEMRSRPRCSPRQLAKVAGPFGAHFQPGR
jgi:hypothetical protein